MIINQWRVNGQVENLAPLVQIARRVLNVAAAFGLFSLAGNQCLIIGRSITAAFNIGTSMHSMGGGGHPGAGSAMIRAINPGVLAAWLRILISGKSHDSGQIRKIMTVSVFTLTPETTMASAFRTLRKRGIHGAPIMEKEQLVGIITRSDAMGHFYGLCPLDSHLDPACIKN